MVPSKKLNLLFSLFFIAASLHLSTAATVYSRKTGNWSDNAAGTGTWSTISVGGAACGCLPAAGDSVVIGGGFTVTQDNGANSIQSLNVLAGATLLWSANGNQLTIGSGGTSGGLTLDGTMTATTNNKDVLMNGFYLYGTGTYAVKRDLLCGFDVKTSSTTNLTFDGAAANCKLDIGAGNTFTNYGTIIIGTQANIQNGTFVNTATATLRYNNNNDWPGSTVLDATAVGNTVSFGATTTGTYSITDNTAFYNLIIDVSGNVYKLRNNPTTVNGTLTIAAGATLNANGKNLEVNGTWTNSGSYVSGGMKVSFKGSSAQTIGGTAALSLDDVEIANTSIVSPQIILGRNLSVNSTLTMTSGNIHLAGFTLTLGTSAASPGTLTYAGGRMYGGTLKRWLAVATIANGAVAGLFPTGTSTDYRPLYVSAPATAPTAGGTISVVHTNAVTVSTVSFADGASTVQHRHDASWGVSTADGLTGGTYNLRAEATSLGTIGDVNDLRLVLTGGVVGSAGVNAGTTSNPQVNRTGLTLANLNNSFYIGSVNIVSSPLPVELISFTAALKDKTNVELRWVTSSENNNDYFNIERSTNGITYSEIAKIKGAGNSTSKRYYSQVDENPIEGNAYYRLKQTDFDGKSKYADVVAIDFKKDANGCVLKVYPNPCIGQCKVDLVDCENDQESPEITVELLDATGRKVYSHIPYRDEKGSFSFAIDTENNLKPGIYVVRGVSSREKYHQKIIVK